MSQRVKMKRQANFKDFKRLGAFTGSSNKKTLYSTRSWVNWVFFGTRGALKRSFHWRFKLTHSCQKKPNLHTNSLNNSILYTKVEKFMIIARAPRLEPEAHRGL
jgi:hypothetical protein